MIAAVVLLLIVYGLYGVIVAMNLWRIAERHAAFYQRHPSIAVGRLGATNPLAWRGYGTVAAAFAVLVLGWLALSTLTRLPTMPKPIGALILSAGALLSVVVYVWVRRRR